MLQTNGLTWQVGGFVIVDHVDLTVRDGEFLTVIGPNGAGKSTLINLLSGVYAPTSGSISFSDQDITTMRPATRTRLGIGRTFQTSSLFSSLTVHENARLAAHAASAHSASVWRRPRARDAAVAVAWTVLEDVGLAERAGEFVAMLNHGDRRKLELAVVLASDPSVLLLDEPTAGVSTEDVQPLVDVVRSVHQQGRTIVMVEHRMDLVTEISDRIAVMNVGRLLACDRPEVVVVDPVVQDAYLGVAD